MNELLSDNGVWLTKEVPVPQTSGTSDISRHFILYSAYNMLYLVASRAKYCLVAMGSELNGISSCLEHSIKAETITVEKH